MRTNRFNNVLTTTLLSALTLGLIAAPLTVTTTTPVLAKKSKATVDPAEQNMREGIAAMNAKDYDVAIDSFLQAIYFSRNKYNPEAHWALGLCYKATRQYVKAVEALQTHLRQVTKKAPDARLDLAECYLDLGDFDNAEKQIDMAFTDSDGKNWARQRYTMGKLQEKMNQPGQALNHYTRALEEKKHYTEAFMGKARCEVKLRRYNEALKDYTEILELGPLMRGVDFHELYYNMGSILRVRGDHQGAADHWRLALEQNPESFDAHLALGNMFDDEKHISSAIKEYQAAMRNAPKGYDVGGLGRRIQYLESSMKPAELVPVVKPTPTMRKQYSDAMRRRQGETFDSAPQGGQGGGKPPVPGTGDAGF